MKIRGLTGTKVPTVAAVILVVFEILIVAGCSFGSKSLPSNTASLNRDVPVTIAGFVKQVGKNELTVEAVSAGTIEKKDAKGVSVVIEVDLKTKFKLVKVERNLGPSNVVSIAKRSLKKKDFVTIEAKIGSRGELLAREVTVLPPSTLEGAVMPPAEADMFPVSGTVASVDENGFSVQNGSDVMRVLVDEKTEFVKGGPTNTNTPGSFKEIKPGLNVGAVGVKEGEKMIRAKSVCYYRG